MSVPGRGPSRVAVRLLQTAMMLQILLGLTRFFGPLVGRALPEQVWRVHPLLGASIAVAVLIVLRPREGAGPEATRRVARFAPLVPLGLGLAIALGLRLGPVLVPLHMVIGLSALGIVDNVLKQLLAASPRGEQHVMSSPAQL